MKNFTQWILSQNEKKGTFTKLIKIDETFMVRQCDGEIVETVLLSKSNIDKISKIIK